MSSVFTSPPMPEWNALTNDERMKLSDEWSMWSCPHSCGGHALHFYDSIRKLLMAKERRIFTATMEGS